MPCLVVEKADEADLLADRVIENHVRCDLSAIELGRAIVKLKRLRGCTAQVLAKEPGISGAELSRMASLLSLPDDIQTLVDAGSVPVSIAYEISRLPDEAGQRELADAVAARKMTARRSSERSPTRSARRQSKPKDSHLSCRIDGVAVSLAADSPLDPESCVDVFRRLHSEAAKLKKDGKPAAALAVPAQGVLSRTIPRPAARPGCLAGLSR